MGLKIDFLTHLMEQRISTTIFLGNGVKLSGEISFVDADCLTLTRDGITQLVMFSAVATVMPSKSFNIHDIVEGE